MRYLGLLVTHNGTRPINKNLDAIVKMTPPKKKQQVRSFLGLVKYYREMWSRQSRLLHLLNTHMSDKVMFKETNVDQ